MSNADFDLYNDRVIQFMCHSAGTNCFKDHFHHVSVVASYQSNKRLEKCERTIRVTLYQSYCVLIRIFYIHINAHFRSLYGSKNNYMGMKKSLTVSFAMDGTIYNNKKLNMSKYN